MRNYNTLIGRYPGADGMKTGFICASGFNLVATATRDGKRLIAVVLGAPSSAARAVKAAQLFERGFAGTALSWLTPSLGTVDSLPPVNAAPPNLREEMCGKHRKRPAAEDEDEASRPSMIAGSPLLRSSCRACGAEGQGRRADGRRARRPPVEVYTGPTRKQQPRPQAHRRAPRPPRPPKPRRQQSRQAPDSAGKPTAAATKPAAGRTGGDDRAAGPAAPTADGQARRRHRRPRAKSQAGQTATPNDDQSRQRANDRPERNDRGARPRLRTRPSPSRSPC